MRLKIYKFNQNFRNLPFIMKNLKSCKIKEINRLMFFIDS